ncbi:MAG: starvation-inducible DNA-binding protein [Lentimonas sp.]|jgi:starvation-inducible DNA-binding protein
MTNKNVTESLKIALSDTYVLYLKTQNFHWNVTGPNFKSLHLLFEEQYNDLFTAVDLLAERIRALGSKAPGKLTTYIEASKIKEGDENSNADSMVKQLAEDQETIVKTLISVLKSSQEIGDEVTAGMVTDRIEVHQKNAWMLNSSL